MGSRIIVYFGVDECLRVPVLEYAGYDVICCESVGELRETLEQTPKVEAVAFAEELGRPLDEAVSAARERTWAALVLFAHPCSAMGAGEFDCVVASGTLPAHWLGQVKRACEQAIARQQTTPAGKGWSEIARDLRTVRKEKAAPEDQPSGLRDIRQAGRIQATRRRWT